MNKLCILAALAASVALSGCVTAADGTRTPDAARVVRDLEVAKAAYCALPEATRQAVRDGVTKGYTVVICP